MQTVKQFIQEWAKEYGYDGNTDFWDFFYDMKPDVEDSSVCAERRAKFEDDNDFDDWYDYDFLEMAKPIMMELFGYTEEDM